MQKQEARRLEVLYQLNLLDTPPSESFDRITRLASQLFDLPIAAVSLTDRDRQWFKSRVGVEHWSIPRESAPCAQVAETAGTLVVPDLLADACYATSGLAASGIRFYAGAALKTREGYGLGALCVLGTEPRTVSENETKALEDLAAMVMAQIELQHAFGRIDPLSGLANRMQFEDDLSDLARDAPSATRVAVLVDVALPAQIDNAARALGSSQVDVMLRDKVHALLALPGHGGRMYHVANTQFAFLAPDVAAAIDFSHALHSGTGAAREASTIAFPMTAAVGIAAFRLGELPAGDVLRMASSAVQDARDANVPRSLYSRETDGLHRRRFSLVQDFEAALEAEDQLRLVFQPKVRLADREVIGAEALLRWNHPTLGPVSPGEFVPLIEHSSLGRGMTEWVMEKALSQLAAWRQTNGNFRMAVNVSAVNLAEADFVQRVERALLRHGIRPAQLELEVTESALMSEPEAAIAQLGALADVGVKIAIDDFGTGYSSMSYLQKVPANFVKIDRSFMEDLPCDERNQSLVRSMVNLTHELGFEVVAEGVETSECAFILGEMKCDEAQGYFFGWPVDAGEFVSLVRGADGLADVA